MTSMTLLSSALSRPNFNHTQAATQIASQQAPVYQFACLFTHDIRRKNTKRWQDGYLSLHSFNGRVMVYDESRNYIGDTFKKDVPLEDGDELNLDRAGVLVQVGEKKATEQTDLTDLLAKRQPKALDKEKQPQARSTTQPLRPQSSILQSSLLQSQPQRRWTGWAARAQIPTDSPHVIKQTTAAIAQKENVTPDGPVRKKQRQDDEHIPLWQILKTSRPARSQPIASSTIPSSTTPQRGPKRTAAQQVSNPTGQARITAKEIIDITGDSSDSLEPISECTNGSQSALAEAGATKPSTRQTNSLAVDRDPKDEIPSRPVPGGVYNTPPKPLPQKPPIKARESSRANSHPKTNAPARSSAPAADIGCIDSPVRRLIVQPETRDQFEGPLDKPDPDFPRKIDSPKARPAQAVYAAPARLANATGRQAAAAATSALKAKAPAKLGRAETGNVGPVANLNSPPRSPTVSTTSRLSANEALISQPYNGNLIDKEAKLKATKKQQTKPLRLSSAAPKKKLFCQTLTSINDVSNTRPVSAATTAANTESSASKRTTSSVITTTDLPTTKRKRNTPRIVSLDDGNSQEVFEVMKPKKQRLEDARRNVEGGSSAKITSAKAASSKVKPAKRSLTKASSPKPAAKKLSMSKSSSVNTTSTAAEGGLPSITNQVDQRPIIVGSEIVTADATAVVRNRPVRPSTDVGIEYGTAPLDAEFLSPVTLSAASALMTTSVNGDAMEMPPLAEEPAQPAFNPLSKSGITTNIRPASHKRPLKRVTSDVSPIKKGPSPRVGLSRRAETMSIIQETRKQHDKAENLIEEAQDKDVGAWSKEAWDLFGGCPAGREERPIWAYDVPELAGCVHSSLSVTGLV